MNVNPLSQGTGGPLGVRPSPVPSSFLGGWAGVIDPSRPTWRLLGTELKKLAPASSTYSMAVIAFGDSRTSGDLLYNPLTTWPHLLSDRLGSALTVNNGKGRTCFWRPNVESSNNSITASTAMPLTSRTDADRAGTVVADANQNYFLFLPNGATSLGFAHTTGTQTGATFYTHSGNVLASKPTTGGTQIYQRNNVAASWFVTGVQNDWGGNCSYADASNVIFGFYNHNQNLALPTGISTNTTVRFFPTSGFNINFDYLFWTEGSHNEECYIGVRNLSFWGGSPAPYYDATADNTAIRNYYGATKTVGAKNVFEGMLRHLSKYQASNFRNPGTTGQGAGTGTTGSDAATAPSTWNGHFGADTIIVIDAFYVNVTGSGALDAPSQAVIDAMVVGKREIRDRIVAETNCFYLALFLPPNNSVNDDRLSYQVTQMKSMCAENDRSAVISIPDVMGYSRVSAKQSYALDNSRADSLHESETFQAMLADIITDVFRYSEAIA